jgi:hypothetical protein
LWNTSFLYTSAAEEGKGPLLAASRKVSMRELLIGGGLFALYKIS